MIKDIGKKRLNELNHSRRYGKSLVQRNRYKPDKSPQLAEDDKEVSEKNKKKLVSPINLNPTIDNLTGPPMGSKPQSTSV